MTSARRCLWLLALVWCGGCSVQMAYNNLDRLARWSVDDYLDMNDAQRAYFDEQFAQLWDWHRENHLPEYASFLDQVALDVADTTNERAHAAWMDRLVDRVVVWADEIERRALPVAAGLLASLSDEQVQTLADALDKDNRELAEPEQGATQEQIRERWREELADRFTGFSGRLNAVQRAHLEAESKRYRPELVLWAEYRQRWQADFLALLSQRHDVEGLELGLRQLSAHRELYFGPELESVYDHNNRLTRELSVWLIDSLEPEQRERFVRRVEDLAETFRKLAIDR